MSPLFLESLHLDAAMHAEDVSSVEEMQKSRRQDERAFFLAFVLSFPFFLAAVFAARMMMPAKAITANDVKPRSSLISEASQAARSTIAVAFAN